MSAVDHEYDDFDQDEDFDPEDPFPFECPRFRVGKSWHCPLAGSEECDWECPN